MKEEYSRTVRIPKNRVAVLIGQGGETKRQLEDSTGAELDVDSEEGNVTIKSDDALQVFKLHDVVKAIGRGFNPKLARLLLKEDYIFDLVKITDHVKDKSNHLERARGRVIGKEGKARETIEKLTETYISIYGKTVGIIGTVERVQLARKAIESLLNGSPHGPIYKRVEQSMKELKKKELLR